MSPKKIHEVTRLASFIHEKATELGVKRVVDIGAGQGYLSHLIVTHTDLAVTAIEGKEHNTLAAAERGKRIEFRLKQECADRFEVRNLWVTPESLGFQEPVLVVGLHTCGDLAASSLKLFVANPSAKALVNVGCCYNHLTEHIAEEAIASAEEYKARIGFGSKGESLDLTIFADEDSAGYPLSTYLKRTHPYFFLGRMPRILAMSEAHKAHVEDPETTFVKFTYRSAFQALLARNFPEKKDVFSIGRRIKRYQGFGSYASQGFSLMGVPSPHSPEELERIYEEEFRHLEKRGACLWTLRSVLSRVVEHLILVDRVLYLREHGASADLVRVFDHTMSPRNLAIFAHK